MPSLGSRNPLQTLTKGWAQLSDPLATAVRDYEAFREAPPYYILDWSEIRAYIAPEPHDLIQFDPFVELAGDTEASLQRASLERILRSNAAMLPPHVDEMRYYIQHGRHTVARRVVAVAGEWNRVVASQAFEDIRSEVSSHHTEGGGAPLSIRWVEGTLIPFLEANSPTLLAALSEVMGTIERGHMTSVGLLRSILANRWLVSIEDPPFRLEYETPPKSRTSSWFTPIWDARTYSQRSRDQSGGGRDKGDRVRTDSAWRDAAVLAALEGLASQQDRLLLVTRGTSITKAVRARDQHWNHRTPHPVRHIRSAALLCAWQQAEGDHLYEEGRELLERIELVDFEDDLGESLSHAERTEKASHWLDEVRYTWRRLLGLHELVATAITNPATDKGNAVRRDIATLLMEALSEGGVREAIDSRIQTLENQLFVEGAHLSLRQSVEVDPVPDRSPREMLLQITESGLGDAARLQNTRQAIPYEIRLQSPHASDLLVEFGRGKTFSLQDLLDRLVTLADALAEPLAEPDAVDPHIDYNLQDAYDIFAAAAYAFASTGRWHKAERTARQAIAMAESADPAIDAREATLILCVCNRKSWDRERLDAAYRRLTNTLEADGPGRFDARYAREAASNRHIFAIRAAQTEQQRVTCRAQADEWLRRARGGVHDDPGLLRWILDSQLYRIVQGEGQFDVSRAQALLDELVELQASLESDERKWPAAVIDTVAWARFRIAPDRVDLAELSDRVRRASQDRTLTPGEREEFESHLRVYARHMGSLGSGAEVGSDIP